MELHKNAKNITGKRYGLLVAIAPSNKRVGRHTHWVYRCDCGNQVIRNKNNVGRSTNSCGCLKKFNNASHGMRNTPTYKAWSSMKTRCLSPNHNSYKWYGARGITVCDRWKTFENFFADMGVRPDGMYLSRINSKGNYEPGNCRWTAVREHIDSRKNNEN